MERSDEQLVRAHLAGDGEAFAALVRRYVGPVFRFVTRYSGGAQDAEDVTQEAFVKAWKKLGTFDSSRSFKTWLFAIARNAAIDAVRKKKATAFTDVDGDVEGLPIAETVVDPAPLPSELLERADVAELLERAMDRLPTPYRMVLLLRYNDHFTFREMAESLGEPLDTLKSRHRRALHRLRALLEEGEDASDRP